MISGYPKVHFRHLITPSETLGGGFIPIFDGVDKNVELMKLGEDDARKNLEIYLNQTEIEPRVRKTGFTYV